MAIFNDSLDIRLCSHDFQEEWGVLGDPISATLTRYRKSPGLLEVTVDSGSPQWDLLLRDGCSIVVTFRGVTEFIGRVYQRNGEIGDSEQLTVYARSIDDVFDNTLAWVVPNRVAFSGSWGGLYSSAEIEPTEPLDGAQRFPDPFMDPSHYMWAYPYKNPVNWDWLRVPWTIAELVYPLLLNNLKRVGYFNWGTLWSQDNYIDQHDTGTSLDVIRGAPYDVIDGETWESPTDPPVWANGFDGFSPRFETLREVLNAFQVWADENTENSFEVTSWGGLATGAHGVRIGLRAGPGVYPVPLSVSAGTVVGGSWSLSEHSASRVIMGGPGEQEARIFQERSDVTRERFGRVIEVFKDATGAQLMAINANGYEGSPSYYFVDPGVPELYKVSARRYFDQNGSRYLADGSPETQVEVSLRETNEIYYGGAAGYRLGQLVNIDLGWMQLKKRVERVDISLTRDRGLSVTPHVGSETVSSDEVQARALRAVADRQRRDNSGR